MPSSKDMFWQPTPDYVASSNLMQFLQAEGLDDFAALSKRSDADPTWYWRAVMRHFRVAFYKPYEQILDISQGLPWARWCVGGSTNLALNCLDAHRDTATMAKPAIVWESEAGKVRIWRYSDLVAETDRLANGLRSLGLGKGDAVGIFMPMLPETVAAFFAIAKIGGIAVPLFSGFGVEAVASRLQDADAVALIIADASHRRGRTAALKPVADEAADRVSSLRHIIVYRHLGVDLSWREHRDHEWQALGAGAPACAVTEEMPADSPFMVIFTSGTSGKAKGTVHTHCGFLTKIVADIGLCMDFKPQDRMLWMSDIGWLVGPMQLVACTFFGATLVIAEGVPDYPSPDRLWRLIQDHDVSYLGISPTIARMMMRDGARTLHEYDLSCLRVVISSGELWDEEAWCWFFEQVCKRRVPLLNVSGGTEIGWGILTSTVLHRLKPCAFSTGVPGMGADVVDGRGRTLDAGQMGELVLRVPSIGLSRGLWRDKERYLETYWNKIPGLWVHGDWASREADGTWYLHGRSDDTIMVAGKRCGPAEVESLLLSTGQLAEAAASAISDPLKGESLLCVCVPKANVSADKRLAEALCGAVVEGLGAAFRPAAVLFVAELPKTRSMKIMRRVVRAVCEGRDPGDLASLVNPSAVEALRTEAAQWRCV